MKSKQTGRNRNRMILCHTYFDKLDKSLVRTVDVNDVGHFIERESSMMQMFLFIFLYYNQTLPYNIMISP